MKLTPSDWQPQNHPVWSRAEIWIPILVILVTVLELWTHR